MARRAKNNKINYNEDVPQFTDYASRKMVWTAGTQPLLVTADLKPAGVTPLHDGDMRVYTVTAGKYEALFDVKKGEYGRGLFAARDFAAEDILTTFDGPQTKYDSTTANESGYAMLIDDEQRDPVPNLAYNFAHLINHNKTFNVQIVGSPNTNTPHGHEPWHIVATEPISSGEELFLDYGDDYRYYFHGFTRDGREWCPTQMDPQREKGPDGESWTVVEPRKRVKSGGAHHPLPSSLSGQKRKHSAK